MSIKTNHSYLYACDSAACDTTAETCERGTKPDNWSEVHVYQDRPNLPTLDSQFHLCPVCTAHTLLQMTVEKKSEVQEDEDLFNIPEGAVVSSLASADPKTAHLRAWKDARDCED